MGECSSAILDLCIRWTWLVTFTPLPLLPWEKCPRYPLNSDLGGSQNLSRCCEVNKNIFSLREIESQPLSPLPVSIQSEMSQLLRYSKSSFWDTVLLGVNLSKIICQVTILISILSACRCSLEGRLTALLYSPYKPYMRGTCYRTLWNFEASFRYSLASAPVPRLGLLTALGCCPISRLVRQMHWAGRPLMPIALPPQCFLPSSYKTAHQRSVKHSNFYRGIK